MQILESRDLEARGAWSEAYSKKLGPGNLRKRQNPHHENRRDAAAIMKTPIRPTMKPQCGVVIV